MSYFTSGCCLDHMDNMHGHAAIIIIRFPSIDDFKLFRQSMAYKDVRLLHWHLREIWEFINSVLNGFDRGIVFPIKDRNNNKDINRSK